MHPGGDKKLVCGPLVFCAKGFHVLQRMSDQRDVTRSLRGLTCLNGHSACADYEQVEIIFHQYYCRWTSGHSTDRTLLLHDALALWDGARYHRTPH